MERMPILYGSCRPRTRLHTRSCSSLLSCVLFSFHSLLFHFVLFSPHIQVSLDFHPRIGESISRCPSAKSESWRFKKHRCICIDLPLCHPCKFWFYRNMVSVDRLRVRGKHSRVNIATANFEDTRVEEQKVSAGGPSSTSLPC